MPSEQPKIDDGGPAFPEHPLEHDHFWYHGTRGMSLRDYFAGIAFGQLVHRREMTSQDMAAEAYHYADAMLKARQQ